MDLLAWRFLRSHGVKAMAHWEASPFFTKDGQDVVKATGPHIVSEGWERVTAKETGGASSRGIVASRVCRPGAKWSTRSASPHAQGTST